LKDFDELGRGGFGVVVLDRANNVAIKYGVNSNAPAGTTKEVALMRKASELGVGPKILNDDNKAIAMEFLGGYKTFYDFKEMQDLGLDGQKQMAKNYISQLEKLHGAGITHGDMYSGNVMFNPQTLDVKIIDYGLSREGQSKVGGADFTAIRKSFGAKTADLNDDGSDSFQVMRHPSVDSILARAEKGTTNTNRAQIFRELYDAIDKIDSLPTFDFEDFDDDF
jgi:tRNA A-37 threonylcarbamoyl transferase component Bud32